MKYATEFVDDDDALSAVGEGDSPSTGAADGDAETIPTIGRSIDAFNTQFSRVFTYGIIHTHTHAHTLEHSNSRYESIRFVMRIDSNRFVL